MGAVTQGSYIVGSSSIRPDAANPLFQHEYGHYLQSQKMGFAYYFAIGIPSAVAALKKSTSDYHEYYTEQDANIRAFKYFNKHIASFYSPSESMWDFEQHPINNFDPSKPLDDVVNVNALRNGLISIGDWRFSTTRKNGIIEAPTVDLSDYGYDVKIIL